MSSFRRLVALFLLAWMPLQAVAVPLLDWHCASQETQSAAGDDGGLPCASHEDAVTDPAGDDRPGNDSGSPAKAGGACCSHASAVPAALVVATAERAPFEAPAAALPAFSFLSRPPTQPPRG